MVQQQSLGVWLTLHFVRPVCIHASSVRTRGHSDVPEFTRPREDKTNQPQPGSAKDMAAR